MQRRGGSGQPVKGQRTNRPRARKAPIPQICPDPQEQVAALIRELKEAREQQAATADVLKVISRSTFDLQKVLDTLAGSAARLCEAYDSIIYLRHAEFLRVSAHYGPVPLDRSDADGSKQGLPLGRGWVSGRAFVDRAPVHINDLQASTAEFPDGSKIARTILAVPLLRQDEAIGVLTIRRLEVKPFTDKQVELVTTFADQAVIAIENVRLFEAEQARTRELSESLEQQTATSEVLKVISSSTSELQPVFQAILENAIRICEANFGHIVLLEGNLFRMAVQVNMPPKLAEFFNQRGPFEATSGSHLDRVMRTKQVSHTADDTTEAVQGIAAKYGGPRSLVAVLMLKDDILIGAIMIYRQEVRPFSDKQIALVQNFAAQAVIAIENTRLLNELRESLQQQTATADVLKIVSSSPAELEPVFQAMLENATRICDASYGAMWLREGDTFRNAAFHGALPAAFTEQWRSGMMPRLDSNILMARAAQSRKPPQVADLRDDQAYRDGQPLTVTAVDVAGIRTLLGVPMFKDDELVGVIAIYRKEVRPFTDKQVELVQNFAAQAVIAIENTRLLNELRESLQQQTATADVLKVISRSTFDLKSVLNTLIEAAARLCEADTGNIALPKEKDVYQHAASYRQSAALIDELTRTGLKVGKGSLIGRTALNRATVHILDAQKDPDYELHAALKLGDYHTMLGVPLLREGNLVGVLGLARQTIRPFTEKQIELVTTFADQAVIAIENARLFEEV